MKIIFARHHNGICGYVTDAQLKTWKCPDMKFWFDVDVQAARAFKPAIGILVVQALMEAGYEVKVFEEGKDFRILGKPVTYIEYRGGGLTL